MMATSTKLIHSRNFSSFCKYDVIVWVRPNNVSDYPTLASVGLAATSPFFLDITLTNIEDHEDDFGGGGLNFLT